MQITTKPPSYAARAVGILEGHLRPVPAQGPLAVIITTADGTEIPGVVHKRAKERIVEDPSLMGRKLRFLIYPRTHRNLLEAIVVDLEEIEDESQPSVEADTFLIQGINIGSRLKGQVQIGIRPNRKSPHQFERFWLTLYGHLIQDQKCVYRVKAIRRGRRLYIVESDPQLPDPCKPKRKQPKKEKALTLIRR